MTPDTSSTNTSEHLTAKVTPATKAAFLALAARTGKSRAALIREAIEEKLQREK